MTGNTTPNTGPNTSYDVRVVGRAETIASIFAVFKEGDTWHLFGLSKGKDKRSIGFTGTEGQVMRLFNNMSLEARDMEGEL